MVEPSSGRASGYIATAEIGERKRIIRASEGRDSNRQRKRYNQFSLAGATRADGGRDYYYEER
jgi:hypothetical protein